MEGEEKEDELRGGQKRREKRKSMCTVNIEGRRRDEKLEALVCLSFCTCRNVSMVYWEGVPKS